MMYIAARNMTLFSALLLSASTAFSNDEQWDNWDDNSQSPWTVSSFGEVKVGRFIQQTNNRFSAKEILLRLNTELVKSTYQVNFKGDARYSIIKSQWQNKVREFNITLDLANINNELINNSWLNNLSLKAGRQSLSWGVGDFIFLNDLYPKDWQAFFNGADTQYLKKTSDAIKLSYFFETLNVDIVYQPNIKVDSLYHPVIPNSSPNEASVNIRAYWSYKQIDYAFYASDGWLNTPRITHGQLEYWSRKSIGASLITPLASGLFKAEYSHYTLKNSLNLHHTQQRWLLGFERELLPRLQLSLQAYLEQDSQSFDLNNRQLLTGALAYQSQDSYWNSQLMLFHSPNHHDNYLRITTSYRYNDEITLSGSFNNLNGDSRSFFGQLSNIDNASIRITYYF